MAGKAIALISLPIFARLLTPAEFGRLDVLNALVSAGLAVLVLGTDLAATRLYFDSASTVERRRLLGSWLGLVTVIAIPSGLLLVVLADPISQVLFGTATLELAVALVGVVLVAGLLLVVALGVMRTTGRARGYALLEGSALVANAVLAIALLFAWRRDAAAVMLALAISWSLAALVGLVAVRASVAARPARSDVARLLRLGLPVAPAAGAVVLGDFINRSVLLGAAGADQAGYLSIGIRIASIAGLLVAAVQLAWQPHAFRLGSSTPALDQLGWEARQITVAVAAAVVALCAVVPEVIAIVGGAAYAGAGPAASLALAVPLLASAFVVASLPSALAKATSDLGWSAMAGVVVAIAANLVLAASLGAVGTAAAMALGQVVALAVVTIRARRHPRFDVWSPGIVIVALAALVFCLVSAAGWELPAWTRAGLAIVFVAVAWIEGTLAGAARHAWSALRS